MYEIQNQQTLSDYFRLRIERDNVRGVKSTIGIRQVHDVHRHDADAGNSVPIAGLHFCHHVQRDGKLIKKRLI